MKKRTSRREFIKTGAVVVLGTAVTAGASGIFRDGTVKQKTSQVFFTDDINSQSLLKIYGKINQNITGKTSIKLHTGEPHGPNILPRDMVQAL